MSLLIFLQSVIATQRLPFWPFAIVVVLSGVVLYMRAVNEQNWNLLFRSTYNSRALSQLIREENIMESSFSAMLVFVFFFSTALLIYSVQAFTGIGLLVTYPLLSFAALLVALFSIYLVKIGLLYLLQFVFEQRELFDEYVTVLMNINITLGIWLLPLNMIYYYDVGQSKQGLLILAGILAMIAFVLRNFRVFEIGLRYKMKWYNIILYLCTLEIMPIILVIMLVKNIGINLDLG